MWRQKTELRRLGQHADVNYILDATEAPARGRDNIGESLRPTRTRLSSDEPLPSPDSLLLLRSSSTTMAAMSLFLVLLCAPALSSANDHPDYRRAPPSPFSRRSNVPPEGYFNPLSNGGSVLTVLRNVVKERETVIEAPHLDCARDVSSWSWRTSQCNYLCYLRPRRDEGPRSRRRSAELLFVCTPSYLCERSQLTIRSPRSFGYSGECLGQHLGDDQAANLGDGHGLCM